MFVIDSRQNGDARLPNDIYVNDAITVSPFPAIRLSSLDNRSSEGMALIAGRPVANSVVAHYEFENFVLERGEHEVADSKSNCIFMGVTQAGAFSQSFAGYDSIENDAAGRIQMYDRDQPTRVQFPGRLSTTLVGVPKDYLLPFLGNSANMRPSLIGHDNSLRSMMVACLNAFIELKDPASATAESALLVLSHLAAMTYGFHPSDHASLSTSLNNARALQARRFIDTNCHDPWLDTQMVANHLGISVRRLHAIFEETKYSVARHIRDARLKRAKRLLSELPHLSVLQVAFSCGFDNQSTFYRSFAQAYGVSPGEYRRSLR